MRRNLPPFAALRAFEAAAKNNSFALAAEDIHLSASAISHQVRALEEYLGSQLFIRDKGRVQLTSKGQDYYTFLAKLFDNLEDKTREITDSAPSKKISINLFRSLLSSWLFNLIPDFNHQHPDIELDFIVSENPPDNDLYEFDLAIHYGSKPPAGYHSVHLFDDYLILTCSPQVAKQLPSAKNLDGLEKQTFLHCTSEKKEWQTWYAACNKEYPKQHYELSINDRSLVLEAAAAGMGIAIGRPPFLQQYLSNHTLTVPYKERAYSNNKYYLIYPKSVQHNQNIQFFEEWIVTQCSEFR
ncbi:MAG: LysR substrate-binding domain-containing protein [Ostreibacterium sp.]